MKPNNPYDDAENTSNEAIEFPQKKIDENIDRGAPNTKSPKSKNYKFVIAAAIIGFAIVSVCVFASYFYSAMKKKSHAEVEKIEADPALSKNDDDGPSLGDFQAKVAKAASDRALAEKAAAEAARAKTTTKPKDEAPDLGKYNANNTDTRRIKSEPTPEEVSKQRKMKGGILWSNKDKDSDNGSVDHLETSNIHNVVSKSSNKIGSMLETEDFADGSVSVISSLKYLLMHGTSIPCTMVPRIVTDYPGATRCVVQQDVYSSSGEVVLIPRGAVVDGDRKVSVKQGTTKVFVAWSTIDFKVGTKGIHVRLDSMAADSLGGAGIDAWIDHHWVDRFGSAVMLSFIEDALVAAEKSKDNSVTYGNTTKNASDLASIALEDSIHIPPTGYVNQAKETMIIVARNVDFSETFGVVEGM